MTFIELIRRLLDQATINTVDELPSNNSHEAMAHAYKCLDTGTTWVFEPELADWVPYEDIKAQGKEGIDLEPEIARLESDIQKYRAENERLRVEIATLKDENIAGMNDVRLYRSEAEKLREEMKKKDEYLEDYRNRDVDQTREIADAKSKIKAIKCDNERLRVKIEELTRQGTQSENNAKNWMNKYTEAKAILSAWYSLREYLISIQK